MMQSHTLTGYRILKDSNSELLETAAQIALAHHERYDGSGYPKGLKGQQIPLEAKITSVADAFDALTTQRPYKPAFSMEHAIELMKSQSGKLFDPEVLAAFIRDPGKIREIMEALEKEPIKM